jgi:hypothetical protein
MKRIFARSALLAALIWAAAGTASHAAGDYCGPAANPDLFYNYYVPPVGCYEAGAVGAQLYVSPRPTPPFVGHTYITYQPLLPQEFLYPHERTYYRDNGPWAGETVTTVKWGFAGWPHHNPLDYRVIGRPAPAIFEQYQYHYGN